jgi:hypothetical protein
MALKVFRTRGIDDAKFPNLPSNQRLMGPKRTTQSIPS